MFISKLRYCASVLVLVVCTLGIENSSRNNNNQIQVIQCKLNYHLRTIYACFSVWLNAGFRYGCWRYNTLTCQFFQAIHGLRIAPGLRHIHLSNHGKLPGFDTYIWSKMGPNLPGFAHTSALNLKIFPGPGNIHFGWFSGVLVDSPTFGIPVPSRNGTWIGAYESVINGNAPLGASVVGWRRNSGIGCQLVM